MLAYGSVWLALAVLIGCFARRTTEAAIASGALWLLIVVMAPSLVLAAVNLMMPPPSQMQLATALKAQLADTARQQQLRHAAASPPRVRQHRALRTPCAWPMPILSRPIRPSRP